MLEYELTMFTTMYHLHIHKFYALPHHFNFASFISVDIDGDENQYKQFLEIQYDKISS